MSEDTLIKMGMLAEDYAVDNERLANVKQSLQLDVEGIKEKYKKPLKLAVDAVVSSHEKLEVCITDNPELFIKPKTRKLSGVKIGFRKASDELVYKSDEDAVIELIKTELPGKKKALIKTTEKLIKPAVKNLPAEELKQVGCILEPNDDIVLIKTADDEIDKFINSLTKDLE